MASCPTDEPRFTRAGSVFAMSCEVQVNIRASAEVVWSLLTDAKGFSRWNSTVTSIEGRIREGERLRLRVPGTGRTFTPKVSGVVPAQRMAWSDGLAPLFRGVRTFVLTPRNDASTDFVMAERFSGAIFALTKGMLPDFRPIFEAYAKDLKREAERVAGPASERGRISIVSDLHGAVKAGDIARLRALLDADRSLVNSRSETDPRGTYPLHVAAEFGQTAAAQLLIEYGADVSLQDSENDAIALGWAAFFGRPGVVRVLLDVSDPNQRNKHGLTPLACAVGGTQGRWKRFSNASLADWQKSADMIKARGGLE